MEPKLKELFKNDLVTRQSIVDLSNKIKNEFLPYFDGLSLEQSNKVLKEIKEGLEEDMKLTI